MTDAYSTLKALLIKKFGAKSEVVQAIDQLEAKPDSVGCKGTLQEEHITVKAEQDSEVLAAAEHLLSLVHLLNRVKGMCSLKTTASDVLLTGWHFLIEKNSMTVHI